MHSEKMPAMAAPDNEPPQRIYVCGQVTGLEPIWVHAKFEAASLCVQSMGHHAINPVTLVGNPEAEWKEAMAICLQALLTCQGIYIQDDWRSSKGAQVEIMLAHAMDLMFLFENPADIQEVAQLKPYLHPGWQMKRKTA
jgi:hypothetical protein